MFILSYFCKRLSKLVQDKLFFTWIDILSSLGLLIYGAQHGCHETLYKLIILYSVELLFYFICDVLRVLTFEQAHLSFVNINVIYKGSW